MSTAFCLSEIKEIKSKLENVSDVKHVCECSGLEAKIEKLQCEIEQLKKINDNRHVCKCESKIKDLQGTIDQLRAANDAVFARLDAAPKRRYKIKPIESKKPVNEE
jgi:hypothetical protein